MYGMIHRAIRSMIIEQKGTDAWTEIENRADIGPAEMISAQTYDDAVTLSIISAACEVLSTNTANFFVQFGEYWIRFVDRGSFRHIMEFTGKDFETFIMNLDKMHEGVQAVMPQAIMPSFKVIENSAGRLVVAYHSERTGLEPFALGLLRGLLERFRIEGHIKSDFQSENNNVFIINYKMS